METVYKLNLDVCKIASQETIYIKQGDNSKKLQVHLCEGGKPYAIPEGVTITIRGEINDSPFFKECTIDNNLIICDIGWISKYVGEYDLEIALYKDEKTLLTQSVAVKVYPSSLKNGEGAIVDSEPYSALTVMVSEGRKLIDDLNEMGGNGIKIYYVEDMIIIGAYPQQVGQYVQSTRKLNVGDIVIEKYNGAMFRAESLEYSDMYETDVATCQLIGYLPREEVKPTKYYKHNVEITGLASNNFYTLKFISSRDTAYTSIQQLATDNIQGYCTYATQGGAEGIKFGSLAFLFEDRTNIFIITLAVYGGGYASDEINLRDGAAAPNVSDFVAEL